MVNISDNLNTLMLNASPMTLRAVTNGLQTFAQQLEDEVSLDLNSGQAKFDESAVRAAAKDLQYATFFAVGTTFPDEIVSSIQGGFAVLGEDQRNVIPWRTLTDPCAVSRLSISQLQALGVSDVEPEAVRREMNARFPSLPPFIDSSVTARLSTTLLDKRLFTNMLERDTHMAILAPVHTNGGGGDKGNGKGAVTKPLEDALKAVWAELAKQATDFATLCLPTCSLYGTPWKGPGICLDRDCALKLANILRAGGVSFLTKAVAAAISAGLIAGSFAASVAAFFASIGGWVGIIIVGSVLTFSIWLEQVVTSNGACITFPWWLGLGPAAWGR